MQTLTREIDADGILTLRMDRVEVHNAFDALMISELTSALTEAAGDEQVRIVVMTGNGSCFSAGADLNWMRSQVNASLEENEQDAMRLAKLMRTLNYLPKPTIAMVNGAAFGGGVGLIAACDMSIAVHGATFGLTEARLGLAPAVVSPYVIRRIGENNARRYFLTGERFDAHEAQRIGLIQQLTPADQLPQETRKLTRHLLSSGPRAVQQCKQLVFKIAGHDRETQRAIDQETSRLIARLRVSAEGQEGLGAFLEKRKPAWTKQ
jgi:methylglutaconyl-CoA hydratase